MNLGVLPPAVAALPRQCDPGAWMQTAAGHQFWPFDPRPTDIYIDDIAHALSNLCRFGGHVREFYSVAQHSVLVCEMLPPELKLAGLLHDATEAYLVDMPRPIKRGMPEYQKIEDRLAQVISQAFGGLDFHHPQIKRADNVALMTEARDLLPPPPAAWGETARPLDRQIVAQPPTVARLIFLTRFHELTKT